MQVCSCPGSTELTSIPEMSCREDFGQIQKIIFQRIYNSGARNSFTLEKDIKELKSWQPLLTAGDSTKVVITPFIEAPTQDGGDARTFGSGNEVLGGMPRILGANPTNMTISLRSFPQEIITAIKELMCEQDLGVYFVNEGGQIEALVDKDTETTFYPIPIRNLFVGDKIHGGFDNPDSNAMSWSLPANYSDQLRIITPNFNPLMDLVPAGA